MAYSFVLKEFCQFTANMMVAERRRVSRLVTKKPARASASPLRPTAKKGGRTGPQHAKSDFAYCLC